LYRQLRLALVSCALVAGFGLAAVATAAAPDAHLVAKPAHGYRLSIAAEKAQLAKARVRAERAERRAEQFELVGGVSPATLEAIAACESGGDPTVVDASGTYYGKYQFSLDTWAAVGGSGSPAEASEAEQDYRASLLYSRAGSSPWPVCGV
jgi:Transglycosylase-like domain